MNTDLAVALTVLCTASVLSNVLTLVAVGRLRQDHNHNTDVLVGAHNAVSGGVTDLTEAVVKGIDFVAQERIGR